MAYGSPYRSPYAAPHRAPRWPWVFASILLVAVILASTLMVYSTHEDTPAPPDDDQDQVALTDATPTETPAPTETPIPTPTEINRQEPVEIARTWASLWKQNDYAGMYKLISQSSQRTISEEDFISRYEDIRREAGIESLTIDTADKASEDGNVGFHVVFTSTLVGDIPEDNTLTFVRESEKWVVAWTPSLIFKDLGPSGCIDFVSETLERGRILDRNGQVLADNKIVARVQIIPGELGDPESTYAALSEIIDLPVDQIRAKVDASPSAAWPVPIKDMPADQSTNLLNALQDYPGVQVSRGITRFYPFGAVSAHLVGWVSPVTAEDLDADETGLLQENQLLGRSGLELGANDLLAGKPGGQLLVVECNTRAERKQIAESKGVPPQDITITVDINFQKQVDASLSQVVTTDPKTKKPIGERSAAVVIDPQTGAIMAMVSHPSFDPNSFVTGNYSDADRKLMQDDVLAPQVNRATDQALPVGSTFKVVTTAAALKYLGYTADTPINCPSSITIAGVTWNDWTVEYGSTAQGMLTLHSGLVQSCNTVFYQIGAALDKENEMYLPTMAREFGLGQRTGIPYFHDVAGSIPDPDWKLETYSDGWARGDAVNLSIGQGYMTGTPLQMANVYATIANRGNLMRPYVVDKTQVEGQAPKQVGKPKVIRKVSLTPDQWQMLHDALRDQTSNARGVGSSKVFGDMQWPVSGKTGTAQASNSEVPHSWFAAYGPEGDGETATIATDVLVENVGEGVTYAAPATRRILDSYVQDQQAAPKPTPTP